MAERNETLILTRSEIASLLELDDYLQGVEYALQLYGQGKSFGTAMVQGATPENSNSISRPAVWSGMVENITV